MLSNEHPKEDYDIKTPTIDTSPHILISSIRKKYLKFLVKLLNENYVTWCREAPPDTLWAAAREIELQAASEAMAVTLYRKSIITMINSLKKHTAEKEIFPMFQEYCVKSQAKSTQTETRQDLAIPEIIKNSKDIKLSSDDAHNFLKSMVCSSGNSDKRLSNIFTNGVTSIDREDDIFAEKGAFSETVFDLTQMIDLSPEDEILKEMEELFGDHAVEMEENKTLLAINMTVDKNTSDLRTQYPSVSSDCGECMSNQPNQTSSAVTQSLDERLSFITNVKVQNSQPQKYFYSRWPCEVYYQKKILREALDNLCERSYKLHVKVKHRFVKLFGYDSDDEQALQSPNTSTDFIRSCRQRAAPFVMRHLNSFFNKMRIQKHLFKPLGRYLLYRLIESNEYPDDYAVYLYLRQYFKNHSRIRCQADF